MLQRRYVMTLSWQRVGGYLINLKVGKFTLSVITLWN